VNALITTESQSHRESGERDSLTAKIIGSAIDVHRALGPGLLESVYEQRLCHELHLRGIGFERQLEIPALYKGVRMDCGYKVDLVVENVVVVELKPVEKILPIHQAQLLTYMKLLHKRVGLLINFNVQLLTQGITRRVL
jgi:GxxExxY protein